jgi:hypothetical protein
MRQRPLFFFFLIAFASSWLLSIPAILQEQKLLDYLVVLPLHDRLHR